MHFPVIAIDVLLYKAKYPSIYNLDDNVPHISYVLTSQSAAHALRRFWHDTHTSLNFNRTYKVHLNKYEAKPVKKNLAQLLITEFINYISVMLSC